MVRGFSRKKPSRKPFPAPAQAAEDRHRLDYIYDFGDGWEHRLTVTDVRAGQRYVSYPRYIGAKETDRPRIAANRFHHSG